MILQIKPANGVELIVSGTYVKGESEVGLSERFEVSEVETMDVNLLDIIEWAGVQGRHVLEKIEEECLEKIHNS